MHSQSAEVGMTPTAEAEREFGSDYLRWAKTHPAARYDLT